MDCVQDMEFVFDEENAGTKVERNRFVRSAAESSFDGCSFSFGDGHSVCFGRTESMLERKEVQVGT
jgi:hypothetical protein